MGVHSHLSIPAYTTIKIEGAEFETTQGAISCDAYFTYDAANERVTLSSAFIGAKAFNAKDMAVMVGAHPLADYEADLTQRVSDNPSAYFLEGAA